MSSCLASTSLFKLYSVGYTALGLTIIIAYPAGPVYCMCAVANHGAPVESRGVLGFPDLWMCLYVHMYVCTYVRM